MAIIGCINVLYCSSLLETAVLIVPKAAVNYPGTVAVIVAALYPQAFDCSFSSRYDFSEPQFGKDVCDRIISLMKRAIRR